MRFLSIIKSAENQGPVPQALQGAIGGNVAFMRLHTEHWPSWEGECEVRPIMFLAP